MILLSGASGFVGRRLATRLAADHPNADLRCLVKDDDDAFGRAGITRLEHHGIRPVPTELTTGRGLSGLTRPAVVFHLAANTHTWERDQGCNDVGTERLVRALGHIGPDTHLIFTSTVAVMDNRGTMDEPLRPDMPVTGSPMSRYGATKWRAEEFLRRESRRHGFRLSIVRLCTVYGPGPRPNSFFDILKQEVGKRSMASRLNWPGLTSFVHVDDVVDGLLNVAGSPPPSGEPRVQLLATESRTLQEVSALIYRVRSLPYRMIRWPNSMWNGLRKAHWVCRWGRACLPSNIYNFLWRFDLVVNPVFHCDTALSMKSFPGLVPRRMEECIGEV